MDEQTPSGVPSPQLVEELRCLLNRHSAENASNTPDFILADYLMRCLDAYNKAVVSRATWYNRMDVPGQGSVPVLGTSTEKGT